MQGGELFNKMLLVHRIQVTQTSLRLKGAKFFDDTDLQRRHECSRIGGGRSSGFSQPYLQCSAQHNSLCHTSSTKVIQGRVCLLIRLRWFGILLNQ